MSVFGYAESFGGHRNPDSLVGAHPACVMPSPVPEERELQPGGLYYHRDLFYHSFVQADVAKTH